MVDFAGLPAASDGIRALARDRGLALVEDAAHSVGSTLGGRPVGALADLTTFSFHPVKTVTTAEGGAITTDDAKQAQVLRDFRNHGLVRERERLSRFDGPWYYEVQTLGFNYRLSAIQCALGRSQLPEMLGARLTCGAVTVIANAGRLLLACPSDTLITMLPKVPAVPGVPVKAPVCVLKFAQPGRPVMLKVSVLPSASNAAGVNAYGTPTTPVVDGVPEMAGGELTAGTVTVIENAGRLAVACPSLTLITMLL